MAEHTSYDAGTPSWVDHAAGDLEASNAFYGALFGWEAVDQGEDMGHYTMLRKAGQDVAGNMAAMGEGQPSVWMSYVSVDDADATIERVKQAGGTDGPKIREALENLSEKVDGVVTTYDKPFTPAALRAAVRAAIDGPDTWRGGSPDVDPTPASGE